MAYWINESAKAGNTRQFQYIMDTDSDKNSLPTSTSAGTQQEQDEVLHLPCGKGSMALSIASGKIFMLNSSDSWVEIGG